VLGEVVREAARRFGDTPAFVSTEGHVLTYSDLDLLSEEVAAGMFVLGIGVGDVVALAMRSGPAYVVAYSAASKLGAVTAGVNERLSAPEKAACLERVRPRLVITDSEAYPETDSETDSGVAMSDVHGSLRAMTSLRPVPSIQEGTQLIHTDSSAPVAELLRELRAAGSRVPALDADPDRPVAIVFTSGTTGLPKGAVFCGRQLEAIGEADGGRRFGGGGRGLGSTSMSHLATMTKLPQNLRSGGTTFLMSRWSAAAALEMVERHEITTLGGIPTQVALMLRHESFDSTDTSSVRLIALGGGPCAPSLVREARQRFGVPVVVRYTCTEAGVGTGTAPDDPPEDAEETVGTPRPGVELTIRDPSGEPLRTGEVGEVCLRSAAVMSGYFEDEGATATAKTTDGAARTGDLGFTDERGRLHLCGRAKEMYVRGGYNVYPLEVEAALSEHASIAQVAVIPRSDPVMGEIGVAVVVARHGCPPPDLEELRVHAQDRLAHHKLPEAIVVLSELPRTAMEKVDRGALQVMVDQGLEPTKADQGS
jgi:acyl-CoA synthetase (AMP-forming)/AMP-acid ligase II